MKFRNILLFVLLLPSLVFAGGFSGSLSAVDATARANASAALNQSQTQAATLYATTNGQVFSTSGWVKFTLTGVASASPLALADATNSSFVIQTTGYYLISYGVKAHAAGAAYFTVGVYVAGVLDTVGQAQAFNSSTSQQTNISCAYVRYLTAGQRLELYGINGTNNWYTETNPILGSPVTFSIMLVGL
jgi:hypothetical protein